MEKTKFLKDGKEVKGYGFKILNKAVMVFVSSGKWSNGNKFQKTPIWFYKEEGKTPYLFVWNLAFTYLPFK